MAPGRGESGGRKLLERWGEETSRLHVVEEARSLAGRCRGRGEDGARGGRRHLRVRIRLGDQGTGEQDGKGESLCVCLCRLRVVTV